LCDYGGIDRPLVDKKFTMNLSGHLKVYLDIYRKALLISLEGSIGR
jgi:hypothetical protein